MRKLSRQISITKLLSKKKKRSESDTESPVSPLATNHTDSTRSPASPIPSSLTQSHNKRRSSSTFSSDFKNAPNLFEMLETEYGAGEDTDGENNASSVKAPHYHPDSLTWTSYSDVPLKNIERLVNSLLNHEATLRTLYRVLAQHPNNLHDASVALSRLVIRLGCPALYFEKLLCLEFEEELGRVLNATQLASHQNSSHQSSTHQYPSVPVPQILTTSSLLTKSFDYFISQPEYHTYLRYVLLPPLASLLTERDPTFSFELDPNTVPNPDFIAQHLTRLTTYLDLFLERIFDSQTIISMPFAIRFIAKQIAQLSAQYNKVDATHLTTRSLIGHFIICRLFTPSIITPDMNNFVTNSITPEQRKNLLLLASVLENLAFQRLFTEEDAPHMCALNPYLEANFHRFGEFLKDLPPADMLLQMQLKRERTVYDRVMEHKHLTHPPEGADEALRFDADNMRTAEEDVRQIVEIIGQNERNFQQLYRCSVGELKEMLESGDLRERGNLHEQILLSGDTLQSEEEAPQQVNAVVQQAIESVLQEASEGQEEVALQYEEPATFTLQTDLVKIAVVTDRHVNNTPQSPQTPTQLREYEAVLEKARRTILNQHNDMEAVHQHLLAVDSATQLPNVDIASAVTAATTDLELQLYEARQNIQSLQHQLLEALNQVEDLQDEIVVLKREARITEEMNLSETARLTRMVEKARAKEGEKDETQPTGGTTIEVVIGGKRYVGAVHPVEVDDTLPVDQTPEQPFIEHQPIREQPAQHSAAEPTAQQPHNSHDSQHKPQLHPTPVQTTEPRLKFKLHVAPTKTPPNTPAPGEHSSHSNLSPKPHHKDRKHSQKSLTAALFALHQLAQLESQTEINKIVQAGGIDKILKIAQKYASSSHAAQLSTPIFSALAHLSIHSSTGAVKVASSENGIEILMRNVTNSAPDALRTLRAFEALAQIALHSEIGSLKISAGGMGINVLFATLKRLLLAVHAHPQQHDTEDLLRCLLAYVNLVQVLEKNSHEHENVLLQFVFALAQQALQEGQVSLCRVYVTVVHDIGVGTEHIQKRLSLLASQHYISYLVEIFSRILTVYSTPPNSHIDDTSILEMLLTVLHNLLAEDPNHLGAMRIDFLMHCGAVGQIFHCMRLFMERHRAVRVLEKCTKLLSQFSERLFYDKQLQEDMMEGLDVLLTANTTTHTSVSFKLRITRIIHELMIPNSALFEARFIELHGVIFIVNNVEECVLLGKDEGISAEERDTLLFWLDELLSILLLMVSHQRFQKYSAQVREKLRRANCVDHMRYISKKFDRTNVATKAHEVLQKIDEEG